MPEDAGSLEVNYVVISDAAIRRLERLAKQFDDVGDAAEKQGKKVQNAHKKNAKAMAAYGAVAMGVLYGLIKASSYAKMWMDQFGHSMTRIANVILEKTGLKDAIDFLVESLSLLADAFEGWSADSFIEFLDILIDKFEELDTKAQLATIGLLVFGAAILILGLAALGLIALGLAIGIVIGLALGLIIVFILWKTGILQAIYDLGEKFGAWVIDLGQKFGAWVVGMGEKFGTWVSETRDKIRIWIYETKEKFRGWVSNVKEMFETFKTNVGTIFDGIWTYIIDGLGTMKDDFIGIITTIINKVSDLISKILSIPSIPWGGGGGGSSGYGTTPPDDRSGDWGDAAATGAHIVRSGVAMVHQGEDVVNLNKMMSGVRMDSARGGDIIINPTINISTNGGMSDPFEANRIADMISKRMGEEVRRISTSI